MIGILTGCGISTIFLLPYPPGGYDACVEPEIQGSSAIGVVTAQGPPVPTVSEGPRVIS